MSTFHFKKFNVRNELSAMKVNTDGVLLGAACPTEVSFRRILDIGTGTGTIALMLAQRITELKAHSEQGSIDLKIIGIDIDLDAASEAAENFSESSWADFMEARHQRLDDFDREYAGALDLIVSNPPYYDLSLTNPDPKKTVARHTAVNGLSFREITAFAGRRLSEGGALSIVLPADQETALLRHGRMNGLEATEILRIRTVERKPYSRVIVSFRRKNTEKATNEDSMLPKEKTLTIMEKGKYTTDYISLTKNFYLFA